ncbi:expressed unknown protein [Seminavis robusta]|uniref:Uncharacterized protein n=1 Tax=Seminavis robusta TaxID=568900 RepID=A0A9N8HSI7_9STRA|nr:expressed unknown protein [Seminavis robusta]|eukprot:Sro1449_g273641.1  (120) ;mRNA; f:5869-6228
MEETNSSMEQAKSFRDGKREADRLRKRVIRAKQSKEEKDAIKAATRERVQKLRERRRQANDTSELNANWKRMQEKRVQQTNEQHEADKQKAKEGMQKMRSRREKQEKNHPFVLKKKKRI